MPDTHLYPRFARRRLEEALADTPVVLIHGPRQCGKSTLSKTVGDDLGYDYITFDDNIQLAAAKADPVGFVAGLPERAVLDEVQRVPSLFLALKTAVDRDRSPGRFILTGSANVLLVPKLADSLAGRMEIIRLHPLAQCELFRSESSFIDSLFVGKFIHRRHKRKGESLANRITAGGFPAALARSSTYRRAVWYREYNETLLQRDVRDLTRIRGLDILPRLLQLASGQTAHLVNIAEMSSGFKQTRPTINDYVTLLERIFLIDHLQPWHRNRLKRLIKTPKLHLVDTGLGAALLGLDSTSLVKDRNMYGQLLETFVYQELRRQASWRSAHIEFYHYRDKDGAEVDVVLETGNDQVAGIEVKSGATVTSSDFLGLRKLRTSVGKSFTSGVVLYDGESVVGFGDGLYAIPIQLLWDKT